MPNNAIIIFSGYNQRAVISFCRVAVKQNIPLFIIASSDTDSILNSSYKKYVKHIRKKLELDLSYIKMILEEIKGKEVFDEYIILPSSEALNRFLLENKQELEELKCVIPLVNKKIYNLISDKYSFAELSIENDILVPQELTFNEVTNFPLVIKSKSYFIQDNKVVPPQIIQNEGEFKDFVNNYAVEDFYIQEYIGGKSYYLLYYFCKDGEYKSFSQQNIIQQSKGKSIVAAIPSDIHKREISNKFINLFKKISFTGLVMIEIKYFNNEFYMIEANPRLWGPSQLFVDSNCNFFEFFLKDCGFSVEIDKLSYPNLNTKYFWLGGLVESLCKYGEVVFHIDNSDYFTSDFHSFLSNDIYIRQDTADIFLQEMLNLIRGE